MMVLNFQVNDLFQEALASPLGGDGRGVEERAAKNKAFVCHEGL